MQEERPLDIYKDVFIYLAGGMQHAGDAGKSWREYVENEFNKFDMKCFNPYKEEERGLKSLKENDKMIQANTLVQSWINLDFIALQKSFAIICLFDESAQRGGGTISELTWAFQYNIPTFLINSYDKINLWTLECCNRKNSMLCKDFDHAIECCKNLYKKEMNKIIMENI